MFQKDPFGTSLTTYIWVIGLACFGGMVKYLNNPGEFRILVLLRDLVTAGFAGLLTFWMCEWTNILGPLSAVLIATSGLMGTRVLKEVENLYRLRLGLPVFEKAVVEVLDGRAEESGTPPKNM